MPDKQDKPISEPIEKVLLHPREVAKLTGIKERYLRDHWKEFGGTRKFGSLKFFLNLIMQIIEAERKEVQQRIALRTAREPGWISAVQRRGGFSGNPDNRCGAMTAQGTPCKLRARGGKPCPKHGGPSLYNYLSE
jgi:hypothetical protein